LDPILATTSRRRVEILDLPLRLDARAGNQSEQVRADLRAAILSGKLAPGRRLPSSRALADQLGVRRNAVITAYELLQLDGLVEAAHGSGTYIAAGLPAGRSAAAAKPSFEPPPPPLPFALGHPWSDPEILRHLATALRRRILRADPADLGYGDPRGNQALRRQIATHLATSRGVDCDPDCVVIVPGVLQGLRMCSEALLRPGDAIWFEDPGYVAARKTLSAARLSIAPAPVDSEGLNLERALTREPNPKAVYVTPSHQFPTAVTMSMQRRVALLEWARDKGVWIFEDDYDSEFRYSGAPLTALAGIGDHDRVVYIGTFSKTLFPGMRLAYLVLPAAAVAPVLAARATLDRFPPSFLAGAVSDLIAEGALIAHTRRLRSRAQRARDVVVETLARSAGAALRLVAPAQGLHLAAHLNERMSPGAAALIRDRAGVQALLISETRLARSGPDGFVLGFAGYGEQELIAAAERLGAAARAAVNRELGAADIRRPARRRPV
jgi:GntR family transcriptional regulator/MocR family aminotransferase